MRFLLEAWRCVLRVRQMRHGSAREEVVRGRAWGGCGEIVVCAVAHPVDARTSSTLEAD